MENVNSFFTFPNGGLPLKESSQYFSFITNLDTDLSDRFNLAMIIAHILKYWLFGYAKIGRT